MGTTLATFRFDQRLTETIDEIKRATSAGSRAEVVRRAIALLKVVQDAKLAGERIVLLSEKGREREIILP